MSDINLVAATNFTPKGWDPNRIEMGQVNGLARAGYDPVWSYLQKAGFTTETNPIDSYFAYYGNGNAADSQFSLLPLDGDPWSPSLTTGKITSPYAAKAAGVTNPVFVIYSNDMSTSESANPKVPTNAQIVGELGLGGEVENSDGSFTRTYDGSGLDLISKTNSAVMELANLALQSAAFDCQAKIAGFDQGAATILFNPDGLGAMIKNLGGNGVSINLDPATYTKDAIYLKKYTNPTTGVTMTPTVIKWNDILTKAVNTAYMDPKYVSELHLPDKAAVLKSLSEQTFASDISGYFPAQAWLIKTFAPNESVATVLNIWTAAYNGVNTSDIGLPKWDVAKAFNNIVTGANQLGWREAAKFMDFTAFDRYERDDLSGQVVNGGQQSFAYTPTAWKNTIDTFAATTAKLMPDPAKQGVMLWQIPSGSLPVAAMDQTTLKGMGVTPTTTYPTENTDTPHSGIEQSYFFGQTDLDKKKPNAGIWDGYSGATKTGMDLGALVTKAYGTTTTYAVQLQGDPNFTSKGVLKEEGNPLHNTSKVFAILWGGGATSTPLSYTGTQWVGASVDDAIATPLFSSLKSYDISASSQMIQGTLDQLDVAYVRGRVADYQKLSLTLPATSTSAEEIILIDNVAGRDKTLNLIDVERVNFSDASVAFDVGGVAGQVANLYDIVLDREIDKDGLGYWMYRLDEGAPLTDVALAFLASPEAIELRAATGLELQEFLYREFQEELATIMTETVLKPHLERLQRNKDPQSLSDEAAVVADFASSPEVIRQTVINVGHAGLEFTPWRNPAAEKLQFFTPYSDMTLGVGPQTDMLAIAAGAPNVTLGFLTADPLAPTPSFSWGGLIPV